MEPWSPPDSEALPDELVQFVKPELQPGERVLWAARALARSPAGVMSPIRAVVFTLTCFGLSVGAFFAIFGPTRPKFLSEEPLLLSTGVIAMIVGLFSGVVAWYAHIGQWWEHGRFASSTYALTDRRAIIWVPQQNSRAVEVHAFARGSIKAIHRLEFPDGSGSVRFHHPIEDDFGPTGFESVADVRFVKDLARRTLIDPRPSAST